MYMQKFQLKGERFGGGAGRGFFRGGRRGSFRGGFSRQGDTCYKCGGTGHWAMDCKGPDIRPMAQEEEGEDGEVPGKHTGNPFVGSPAPREPEEPFAAFTPLSHHRTPGHLGDESTDTRSDNSYDANGGTAAVTDKHSSDDANHSISGGKSYCYSSGFEFRSPRPAQTPPPPHKTQTGTPGKTAGVLGRLNGIVGSPGLAEGGRKEEEEEDAAAGSAMGFGGGGGQRGGFRGRPALLTRLGSVDRGWLERCQVFGEVEGGDKPVAGNTEMPQVPPPLPQKPGVGESGGKGEIEGGGEDGMERDVKENRMEVEKAVKKKRPTRGPGKEHTGNPFVGSPAPREPEEPFAAFTPLSHHRTPGHLGDESTDTRSDNSYDANGGTAAVTDKHSSDDANHSISGGKSYCYSSGFEFRSPRPAQTPPPPHKTQTGKTAGVLGRLNGIVGSPGLAEGGRKEEEEEDAAAGSAMGFGGGGGQRGGFRGRPALLTRLGSVDRGWLERCQVFGEVEGGDKPVAGNTEMPQVPPPLPQKPGAGESGGKGEIEGGGEDGMERDVKENRMEVEKAVKKKRPTRGPGKESEGATLDAAEATANAKPAARRIAKAKGGRGKKKNETLDDGDIGEEEEVFEC
ncbi:hypothetical protein CRUP_019817 [Coryphaenoides rupestris]|nr:hypothetical protein CRUP_019817 [Coryphaenoides rupestris]